jgi:alkylhydroperoxidase/carboxymuconolactone decarboxylase family protein YurZ
MTVDSDFKVETKFDGSEGMDPEVAEEYRQLAEIRGYHFPNYEWLGRFDPAFERTRMQYIRMTYTREDGALPVKYRELIAALILAYRLYPSTGAHFARALREGLTVREIVEALELASIPGGQPLLLFGIDHLVALEAQEPELFKARSG